LKGLLIVLVDMLDLKKMSFSASHDMYYILDGSTQSKLNKMMFLGTFLAPWAMTVGPSVLDSTWFMPCTVPGMYFCP